MNQLTLSQPAPYMQPRSLAVGLGVMLMTLSGYAQAFITDDYFPLTIGATWTTRSTVVRALGDQPPPHTTVSTMVLGKKVAGQQTTKLSWVSDEAEVTDRHSPLYFADISGTLLAGSDQMEPDPIKAECLPVPTAPHFVLPRHVSIGQKFTGEFIINCEGGVSKTTVITTVLGFSETTVPAGKFRTLNLRRDSTIKVTWQGRKMPDRKEVSTLSLARNVGTVKEVIEEYGIGAPHERSTETIVLMSTNRKYDARGDNDG